MLPRPRSFLTYVVTNEKSGATDFNPEGDRMNFKIKSVLALCSLVTALNLAHANYDKDYLTIKSVKVEEISDSSSKTKTIYERDVVDAAQLANGTQNLGEVIATANEIVALGERIYTLVDKGRPTNRLDYSPISILPKVNGVVADILDTEGWRAPVKRSYRIAWKNLYGMEVVIFKYSVIYSYGGTYNGKGAYLTAAQIIPDYSSVSFGFNFAASMKLVGLQNHGTKSSPIAGAVIQLEYTVNNILQSDTYSDTFHITGQGSFKSL